MKARTTKALIGWYASRRKGPRMARQGYERIDASPIDNEEAHFWVGQNLARILKHRDRLDRVLAWASVSDGSVELSGWDKRLLRDFREQAHAAGYLQDPVRPVAAEYVEGEDVDGVGFRVLRALWDRK